MKKTVKAFEIRPDGKVLTVATRSMEIERASNPKDEVVGKLRDIMTKRKLKLRSFGEGPNDTIVVYLEGVERKRPKDEVRAVVGGKLARRG